MTGHVKFPSIEDFAHVWRNQQTNPKRLVIHYSGKIKLDGTNAAVRLWNGTVTAQSRERDITPDNDNAGFAAWVATNREAWRIDQTLCPETITVHGEWAGNGIQNGDAVSMLDRRYFFVFAVHVNHRVITDPVLIEGIVPDLDEIVVLPWHPGTAVTVDFGDPEWTGAELFRVDEAVVAVATEDPFIRDVFEVSGPGEGLVFMPMTDAVGVDQNLFGSLTFKAKAERHRVKKTAQATACEIEMPTSVREFVDVFVTEARCRQGLTEACDGIAEKPRLGTFLKWLAGDILKESAVEIEGASFDWKQAVPHINKAAVTWFMRECSRII